MRNYSIIIAITIILGLNGLLLSAQQSTTNYVSSSEMIANPERGWYDDYYSHSGGSNLSTSFRPLSTKELVINRERDNITLILRLFYLHEFLDQNEVSAVYLAKIQADFDSVRAAGVKCLVRFAYSASDKAAIWDATPEKVFSHIESLRNVLSSNGDIIAGVQAGFIGAWGEWYYTRNFATSGYSPSATDQLNRRNVVEKLLDVLPENVSVDVRTPAIMRNIVQSDTPISMEEAFTGSVKSRVGSHNDCFLANKSDYGTYGNLVTDLAYLHETTKYTITGGETCDASNSYSDCPASLDMVKNLHWTYLNRDYNKLVYDKWKLQSCYNEISLSFGYRIRLVSAIFPDSANQNSSITVSANFANDGYAAPTQYKPVQVVLTNTVTGEDYFLKFTGINDDIRYWLPGEIKISGNVQIPIDLADGNYLLGLRFPDQSTNLAGIPSYSIQLANVGTWNADKGINTLNHIIVIGNGGEGSLPKIPLSLAAQTISETQINLAWSHGDGDENGFEIMRAEGDENIWKQIAVLGKDFTNFSDANLQKGSYYHYIIRGVNTYGNSAWSEVVTSETLGVGFKPVNVPSVTLYPNPLCNSPLYFYFPDNSMKKIVISKITGGKVFETSTDLVKFQIDQGILKPGMYLVTMNQVNAQFNRKLIVL